MRPEADLTRPSSRPLFSVRLGFTDILSAYLQGLTIRLKRSTGLPQLTDSPQPPVPAWGSLSIVCPPPWFHHSSSRTWRPREAQSRWTPSGALLEAIVWMGYWLQAISALLFARVSAIDSNGQGLDTTPWVLMTAGAVWTVTFSSSIYWLSITDTRRKLNLRMFIQVAIPICGLLLVIGVFTASEGFNVIWYFPAILLGLLTWERWELSPAEWLTMVLRRTRGRPDVGESNMEAESLAETNAVGGTPAPSYSESV